MLFGAGGGLNILFRKDANNTSSDLVVDYRLVVLTDDIDPEFLVKES